MGKIRYLCIVMSTSRIFHSVHLDISTNESNRICYIVLPEKLKESEKEKDGKNPRLAAVQEETDKVIAMLKAAGKEVFFEYNEGNHFGPLIERIEKAITNILSPYA